MPADESHVDETLRRARSELAAGEERNYLDEDADRAAAEGYYAGIPTDSDPATLFGALSVLLETTHHTRPGYKPAVELYPWVDLQPDRKVRSCYTQEEFEPEDLINEAAEIEARRAEVRRVERAVGAGAVEASVEEQHPYNCEHTVPQSWFDHDEPMRGDLHHLLTCERNCNSFRNNSPYTDYPETLRAIREQCGRSEAPGFEPWTGKGLVARTTLYFLIRYPGTLHARAAYSAESLAMFMEWHASEPAGEYELHRNATIFERQGNRNPLIDHPEWASRIAFDQAL